jgi:hypothetical protein
MEIVSASRRTDIPAFYADWLLRRVREGWAASVNPFNGLARRVSLRAADVRALVLWSKDLSRFDDAAAALDDAGLRLYFQYTLTGLPPALEPAVPPPDVTIPAAHRLAARFGAGTLQWRYDPILLGGALDLEWHRRRFAELLARLDGATTRCIISFATFYRKVERNLGGTPAGRGLAAPPPAVARALADELAALAAGRGVALSACCSPDALRELPGGPGAERASCVDAAHIDALWPGAGQGVPPAPSRPGCGCHASRDIGLYDSCPHGCLYCYANADPAAAARAHARADSVGPVPYGRLVEQSDGSLRWTAR